MRSAIRKFLKSAADGDREAAAGACREAVSRLDGAVSKGLHHRNRAARLKSRLNSRLRAVGA